MDIQTGQVWHSPDTGTRYRVVGLCLGHKEGTGKITVERLPPRPRWEEPSAGRYVWAPECFRSLEREGV